MFVEFSLKNSKLISSNSCKRFLLSDGQPSINIRFTVSPNPSIIFASSTAIVPPHVSPMIVNVPFDWICFKGYIDYITIKTYNSII